MEKKLRILSIVMVGVVLFSSCSKNFFMMNTTSNIVSTIEGDFLSPLTVPPINNGPGSLTAQVTTSPIFNGKKSRVLGYQSGSILGPTIVVNSGDKININFQNNLSEKSNIH